MKYVFLTLLVFAVQAHAAPILADVPAEALEEEALPEIPSGWWRCTAVSMGPLLSPPFVGVGPTRPNAELRAWNKCRINQPPYLSPSHCVVQECHRVFGPIRFAPGHPG
jgi:hypothetical protein